MPRYRYTAAPLLQPRRAPEILARLIEQVLDQGGYAVRHLRPDDSLAAQLAEAGYLAPIAGGWDLTPRALEACEEHALLEVLSTEGGRWAGQHLGQALAGSSPEPGDEVRPLRPGEPVEHVDLNATLRAALSRSGTVQLHPDDVHLREPEQRGRCSTVVLLDLSGSMGRHGRFAAARRAALALRALVKRRFPGDTIEVIGFATRAVPLDGTSLLKSRPVEVDLFEERQRVRLPAWQAFDRGATNVPEHFTNIQAALRLARHRLGGHGEQGRHVLLITDGEPTAHLKGNELVLGYPATEETIWCTLQEARHNAAAGISLSVLALVGEFSPPGLKAFVDRLAQAGRGQTVVATPRHLGGLLIERFVRGRR